MARCEPVTLTSWYCPKCGMTTIDEPTEHMSPGVMQWTCPECLTVWKIDCEYREVPREP